MWEVKDLLLSSTSMLRSMSFNTSLCLRDSHTGRLGQASKPEFVGKRVV